MRTKVEFPTNIPQLMKLDFDSGVLKPATKQGYSDEYQYVLDNDLRIMWVKPEVHALIQRTGAKAGDEICIERREIKDGRSKKVVWEVQLVGEEPGEHPQPAAPPIQPASQPATNGTPAKSQTAATAQLPPASAPQGQPDSITDPAAEGALTRSLCTALAAARSAELYAARLGMAVRFSGEDVRALAITAYISATKGAR